MLFAATRYDEEPNNSTQSFLESLRIWQDFVIYIFLTKDEVNYEQLTLANQSVAEFP